MNAVDEKLIEREREGRPIRVALIGAGQMGVEIATQAGEMVGFDVVAAVDLTIERAAAAFADRTRPTSVVQASTADEVEKAIRAGKHVATTDYRAAIRAPSIDAVVDATGSVEMGAVVALEAFEHKKHVVMMSVECDVTIGAVLNRFARQAGVVYTLAAGDEPAAIVELYRFARTLGFEIVSAGKGKNNPLNIYSTPETEREKAEKRKMNPRMLSEFVDGSKTAIEMTAVSNATGLVPDVRGMHGARATVETIGSVFIPKADGGVLSRSGVVDFAIGVHPGVFVIAKTLNARIRDGMSQRDMGAGPYYPLFRPFHLCSVEVPHSVCQAVFYGESTGNPLPVPTSECIAVAKRDLEPGETLDGIGEYCYRGSIDTYAVAKKEKLLPLGLARNCVMKRAVAKDHAITYDDITIGPETVLWQLRRIQDALHGDAV